MDMIMKNMVEEFQSQSVSNKFASQHFLYRHDCIFSFLMKETFTKIILLPSKSNL